VYWGVGVHHDEIPLCGLIPKEAVRYMEEHLMIVSEVMLLFILIVNDEYKE
jgi:hypothetical protein